MRVLVLIALLSAPALGDELYIIPVFARNTATYGSRLRIANPHAGVLTPTVDQAYGYDGPKSCRYVRMVIGPRQSELFNPDCDASVVALVIRTDRSAVITHEVRLGLMFTHGITTQHIPTFREWIPGDREVIISDFEIYPGYARANLFVVNPNEFPIKVSYDVIRAGFEAPGNFLEVPPQSIALQVVPTVEVPIACIISPCVPEHSMRIRATGQFVAGVSTIYGSGDAVFRAAIPVEE